MYNFNTNNLLFSPNIVFSVRNPFTGLQFSGGFGFTSRHCVLYEFEHWFTHNSHPFDVNLEFDVQTH